MRVCKHGWVITLILIGYVVCVVRCIFWLAGRNYQRVSKNNNPNKKQKKNFFRLSNYVRDIFYKSMRWLFFRVNKASSRHLGSWRNSRQLYKSRLHSGLQNFLEFSNYSTRVQMRPYLSSTRNWGMPRVCVYATGSPSHSHAVKIELPDAAVHIKMDWLVLPWPSKVKHLALISYSV